MNLAEMKRKYAYTLAKVGLNVQKGQPVLVEATIKGAEFTPIFAEECYKLGASNVIIHYLDEPNLKIAAKYRSDADIRKVEDWEELQCQKYLDEGACYVRLEGVDPKLMEDVPEAQANAIFAHIDLDRLFLTVSCRNHFLERERKKRFSLLVCACSSIAVDNTAYSNITFNHNSFCF